MVSRGTKLKKSITRLLKEFADGTSIHGLAFMVDSQASLLKKLVWFFLFLASVVYATLQLKTAIVGKLNQNGLIKKQVKWYEYDLCFDPF